MKKVLSISVLLTVLSLSCVFAQVSSGTKMIGGGVAFTSYNEETGASSDFKSSGFSLEPSLGYFVSENLAVGLNLGFESSIQDNGFSKERFSGFSVGPFARLYKFTSNDKFAFFGEAAVLFGSQKNDPDGPGETKSSSLNFSISPGFAYFFNEKWVIDLKLRGISFTSVDPNKDVDNDKESIFIFGPNSFNPSLGFRFLF